MPVSVSILTALVILLIITKSRAVINRSSYDLIANRELERMKKLVEVTHNQLLQEKCSHPAELSVIRSVLIPTFEDGARLKKQAQLYNQYLNMLIRCREGRESASTSSTTATPATKSSKMKPATDTTATSPAPQTTDKPLPTTYDSVQRPLECENAINLTEYWRQDPRGSQIFPGGRNNDFRTMVRQGRPWFRFSEGAGDVMLDRCVAWGSCGTAVPIYTSSVMPSDVGMITTINLLGNFNGFDCKSYNDTASVMRCSNRPNDLIYRYEGNTTYYYVGFCGMKI